jgi:lysophospholipase
MGAAAIDRRRTPDAMRIWEWEGPDGWRHRRADWPQPPGAAVRGSLLFAGGRGDFIEKYLESLVEWHRGGWNIASFDWRGQGKSRGHVDNSSLTSFDVLVRDLAALVADWRSATPGPHVIVAHSMGGHMLLRLLVDQQPDIAAAVLVAPMIEVNSAPAQSWFGAWLSESASWMGFGAQPLWRSKAPLDPAPAGSLRQNVLTSCPDRYSDEEYWWRLHPDLEPSTPSFAWLRAAYRSAARFTPASLGAVTTPVLVVATRRDRLVSHAAIERVVRLLPKAELALFDEAAHEILRERAPIRSAAMSRIDAFLREHVG